MKEKISKIKNLSVPLTLATGYCIAALPFNVIADGDIADSLWSVANQILRVAQSILFPVLAILTVFFGIKIFIANDAKSVEAAKGNALRCGIGALIVLFAPTIVKTIQDALQGKGVSEFNKS